ncbi:MAG: helix-turn-helix transcriptional regulator [Candidatus Methanomethylophilaceae archaeon]|nr:helix-turn-helix transcriptional regulator [Candidatus Methanomethylophilaceae archaeon]MBQ9689153.1 helix-turn-helix transcriptional regulator [Candidatus Methanomethylophilaceae archaeon]MBR4203745.1 helix-turn-helix transcriptional regulator [Candidatus Methanomethylophilaceae archaeon]MBR6910959.1 helix-turn-helix transcriptional regulator [Candidatus Methanomethylophilaceae archaeon]
MADMNKVGKRICKYREQMGLSQEELAVNSGISLQTIKEYEEGIAYPPIGSLIRLSRALGQRVGTFTDDQFNPDPIVVKLADREEEASSHGDKGDYTYYPLGKGKTDRHMEPMFIKVGEEDMPELSSHEGEEFIVVMTGKILFVYGKEKRILEPGDSAYYNSVVPHYVGAIDGPAEIYAVLYTPL